MLVLAEIIFFTVFYKAVFWFWAGTCVDNTEMFLSTESRLFCSSHHPSKEAWKAHEVGRRHGREAEGRRGIVVVLVFPSHCCV